MARYTGQDVGQLEAAMDAYSVGRQCSHSRVILLYIQLLYHLKRYGKLWLKRVKG